MVAIDLGAAATKAAWAGEDGVVTMCAFGRQLEFPTAVFVDRAGTCVVEDAESYRGSDRFLTRIKQRVTESRQEDAPAERWVGFAGGSERVTLIDLIAAILRHSLAAVPAGTVLDGDPIVLTHPVFWSRRERDLLAKALEAAGASSTPTFLSEPEAVAGFAVQEQFVSSAGGTLAVFDLGACSLDIAVVQHDDEGMGVLASRGWPRGGDDFDDALLKRVVALLEDEGSQEGAEGLERLCDERLALVSVEARRCKEQLSAQEEPVTFATQLLGGGFVEAAIHRADLIDAIEPIVEDCIADLDVCLGSVSATVDALVVTGGSTRVPWVRERLEQAARAHDIVDFVMPSTDALARRSTGSAAAGPGQCVAPGALYLVRERDRRRREAEIARSRETAEAAARLEAEVEREQEIKLIREHNDELLDGVVREHPAARKAANALAGSLPAERLLRVVRWEPLYGGRPLRETSLRARTAELLSGAASNRVPRVPPSLLALTETTMLTADPWGATVAYPRREVSRTVPSGRPWLGLGVLDVYLGARRLELGGLDRDAIDQIQGWADDELAGEED